MVKGGERGELKLDGGSNTYYLLLIIHYFISLETAKHPEK